LEFLYSRPTTEVEELCERVDGAMTSEAAGAAEVEGQPSSSYTLPVGESYFMFCFAGFKSSEKARKARR
jgi:hypothetical protein